MEQTQKAQSKKSHSWWWDSHISPQNSTWLSENLEEMEKQVKEMLGLIEEGKSSAEKVEMNNQQPMLISHVQNFHHMYRALAERYDNVTGELRKNIPSSLQSLGPFGISESDSVAHQKRKSPSDCFDVSIGSGVSSDVSKKGSDGSSSSSESDLELDEAKDENGNTILYALSQRIIELENELHAATEKLVVLEEKNMQLQCNFGANSEVDTNNLEKEIDELKGAMASSAEQFEIELAQRDSEINDCKQELELLKEQYLHGMCTLKDEIRELQGVIIEFEEDRTKLTQENLQLKSRVEELEQAVCSLDHLASGMAKLQEVIKNTQTELEKVSKEKEALEERAIKFEQLFRDFEISGMEVAKLPETIKSMELQLERALQEKSIYQDQIMELDQAVQKHSLDKSCLNAELLKLSDVNTSFEAKLASMEAELKRVYDEKAEESLNSEIQIAVLNQDLGNVKSKLESLFSEKAIVDNRLTTLLTDITSRDEKMKQMNVHLNQLQHEHAKLIAETDSTRKSLSELHARVCELEEEVEMQKLVISEGADRKREAIRQLCFSLEHYRSGYQQLRDLLHGQKRSLVMAT